MSGDGSKQVDDFFRYYRHSDWLQNGPLCPLLRPYVGMLLSEGYRQRTIKKYIGALTHFNSWAAGRRIPISKIDEDLIKKFIVTHLPRCSCTPPRYRSVKEVKPAMQHAVRLMRERGLAAPRLEILTPIAAEVARFRRFLLDSSGLAESTCKYECRWAYRFLDRHFGNEPVDLSHITPKIVDSWILELSRAYRNSLKLVRTSLRSYFRFRATQGDDTTALTASLPSLPAPSAALIRTMSDSQLRILLKSFDLHTAEGLRDYAMVRCLSDLGLRAKEVIQLSLDDINWHAGTITIRKTKGRHPRTLPLPVTTGRAIAGYLKSGRPELSSRLLFSRMRAPLDRPLTEAGVRHALKHALTGSGLAAEFGGTHILRRTLATKLQRRGVSVKAIADVLGHLNLQTTMRYAGVDFERLRRLALQWVGEMP
jgi:integrase/recombinase XerD